MKTFLKVLPISIACALLVSISSVSATCSYVGVSQGNSWDFNALYKVTNSSGTKILNGTIHIVIASVAWNTTTSCCDIGTNTSVTSGNITSEEANSMIGTIYVKDTKVINLSYFGTVLNLSYFGPIISTNVSNKSYSNYTIQSIHNYNLLIKITLNASGSWDNMGMMIRLSENLTRILSGNNYYSVLYFSRISSPSSPSVPGYESWVLLLAGVIGIVSVIGIALKKRY